MSVQKDNMINLRLTDINGKEMSVHCPNHIVDMLISDETDSQVKEMIVNSLMHESTSSSSHEPVSTSNKVSKWTPEAEKLLLDKYTSAEEGKTVCKNKWKQIANEVNKYGYNFTGENCRLKIKCLKEKYERNKKKNKKSGESPADSDSEDLLETFTRCPDMKPVYVVDSGNKSTKKMPPLSDSDDSTVGMDMKKRQSSPAPLPNGKDDSTCGSEDAMQNEKKRPRRSVEVMKDFLQDVLVKREEAAERRHREKMESVNSLISVLKDAVKKDA